MNEWKTIDSAPDDGSDVLVFAPTYREQFVAFLSDGKWCYALDRDDAHIFCHPTHWMPLPPPPAESP